MKGYVHVYTGNGKGKTTAALGLALRATGAGKKVYIAQFAKGMHYSELDAIAKHLPDITLKQYGLGCFIFNEPKQADIEAANIGLREVEAIISGCEYDIIILDEANIATYYNLFSVQDLISVLNKRNPATEIIITGRYACQEIIEYADLVTEMAEIKHYYQQGVQARVGIEK
ncbi:MAG TPA: cob(I)yrinic acid a,c-diamide adenosyltransferase [Paludibacter sp.]|nr:cob(I)yrinic acid a,c-diamide adenosyltransferase [Paludibacter sp.]